MPGHPLFRGIGYAGKRETRVPLRPKVKRSPHPTELGFHLPASRNLSPEGHRLFRKLWIRHMEVPDTLEGKRDLRRPT